MRTSDWEAKLSQPQITYAANDAHCALSVYNVLMAMAKENEREINWGDCSCDLRQVYQQKTAATVAAAERAAATIPPVSATGDVDVEDTAGTTEAESHAPATLSRTASISSTVASGSSAPRASPFARPLAYVTEYQSTSQGSSSRPSSRAGTSTPYGATQSGPPRPQHLRAYNMWHHRKMALRDICAALRSKENPLAESTVM